ncbi:MAG: DUF362 domain-containing protein [Candidatus Omnitrophota bacterium]
MRSKVYFTPVDVSDTRETVYDKLRKLLRKSDVFRCISSGDNVAAKIHFGEEGNTGYVDPVLAGVICREAAAKGAGVRLGDANVLYRGRRKDTAEHLRLAHEHGFTRDVTGVDIVIPDETRPEETCEIDIDREYIKKASVGRFFVECDSMIVITHFKGHGLTGFGGAIKNVGMGCATRQGKLAQHNDAAPVVYPETCTACGACVAVCPADALTLRGGIRLDTKKCVGCANCVGVCPTFSLFVDFKAGAAVQKKAVEYAYAVLRDKREKSAFVNIAMKINKECDCWGKENPRIAPDVGIFASSDPVAIDRAAYDRVNAVCHKNVFTQAHPDQDGAIQLSYAEKIGLGNQEYDLVEV